MSSDTVYKPKIATWKIDAEEEKRLASSADNDETARKAYVEYYRKNDPQYFEKGLSMIQKTIDLHRPGISQLVREKYLVDMVYSLHRFGCMFNEYFMFDFEHLNTQGRESFITDKIRWNYYSLLNTSNGIELLDDKMETYRHFHEYYNRDLIQIDGMDGIDLFKTFIAEHKNFIKKPLNAGGGRDISVFHDIKLSEAESVLQSIVEKGSVVLEELIEQDKSISSFHCNSVNTVRLPTVLVGDTVYVFHPILRTGQGTSCVDNTSGGGIFAPIDAENGVVYGMGLSRSGKRFLRHPDSGVVFPGFVLPKWEQAIELVTNLAKRLKDVHYVGWDLAFSKSGWVMVEGNANAEFVGWQSASRTGVRQEIEEYIKQLN